MSEYNIPIIEPTIDYTKVPPINQKRTIAFINHFIAHTIVFLNKFSLNCEEKFFDFENKLQKIEAALEILEARLSSIPKAEDKVQTEDNIVEDENEKLETKQTEQVEVVTPETDETTTKVSTEVSTESNITKSETEIETEPISSNPEYVKYFKMIHFGVPKQAVKLSMEQEGLDSSVLDNPNQRVPKSKSVKNENVNTNN